MERYTPFTVVTKCSKSVDGFDCVQLILLICILIVESDLVDLDVVDFMPRH